jgi:hypothetical protein
MDGTSSTIVGSGGVALFPYPLQVAQPASVNYFQLSGQWLFAWIAGWIGATIAGQCHLQRTSATAR